MNTNRFHEAQDSVGAWAAGCAGNCHQGDKACACYRSIQPAEACTEVGANQSYGGWEELPRKDKLFVSYVLVLLIAITMGGLWLALLMTKPN